MPVRFNHVSDKIFRGGEPSVRDLEILSDVFNIKRVISLDGTIGNKIHPICEKLGIDHIIIPIGGKETSSMIDFLKNNIQELFENQPLYVHCRHGKDRTGMAVALYRTNVEKWEPQEALQEALSLDFGSGIDKETKDLYQSSFYSQDSNNLEDYKHNNYYSAHDDLMPTSYQAENLQIGNDIASLMRDQFNFGDVAPAFNPQQSFSPLDDYKVGPPREELLDSPPEAHDPFYFMNQQNYPFLSEEEKNRRKTRKELLNDIINNNVQVGQYDNYGGIWGAGPLAGGGGETGGFMNSLDRGSSPGVGAVETGGLGQF